MTVQLIYKPGGMSTSRASSTCEVFVNPKNSRSLIRSFPDGVRYIADSLTETMILFDATKAVHKDVWDFLLDPLNRTWCDLTIARGELVFRGGKLLMTSNLNVRGRDSERFTWAAKYFPLDWQSSTLKLGVIL